MFVNKYKSNLILVFVLIESLTLKAAASGGGSGGGGMIINHKFHEIIESIEDQGHFQGEAIVFLNSESFLVEPSRQSGGIGAGGSGVHKLAGSGGAGGVLYTPDDGAFFVSSEELEIFICPECAGSGDAVPAAKIILISDNEDRLITHTDDTFSGAGGSSGGLLSFTLVLLPQRVFEVILPQQNPY